MTRFTSNELEDRLLLFLVFALIHESFVQEALQQFKLVLVVGQSIERMFQVTPLEYFGALGATFLFEHGSPSFPPRLLQSWRLP